MSPDQRAVPAIALLLCGCTSFPPCYSPAGQSAASCLGCCRQILLNGLPCPPGSKSLLALNATYGFWGLIILMCWHEIGYMMIIYIASFQNVPELDLSGGLRID